MNKANPNSDKTKSRRKLILPLSIVGALIVIGLAFILPSFATDGTENFTGKEAQVAKEAIGSGNYNGPSASPIPNLAITFKTKVTKVRKSNPEKKCGIGGEQATTYFVDIDRVTFFGLVKPGYTQPLCIPD
jgi:hypothetical protein